MGKYDDIIDLPHHVSATRPQMSMQERAAQFSPFAALVGYDAAIRETGRVTETQIEQDEEALTALNRKFQLLRECPSDAPEIAVTYFAPDERKAGGAYREAVGKVKKLDTFERLLVLWDGTKIALDHILAIDFPAGESR